MYLNTKTNTKVKVNIDFVPDVLKNDLVEYKKEIPKPEILKPKKVKDESSVTT